MTAKTPDRRESDLEIIARYTDQPERLPRDLRQRIEREWGGLPVQLYGMADLDSSMRFARTWLALGPGHIALAHQSQGAGRSEIRVFERSAITGVREAPGLSCTVLTILGAEGQPALAVLRFTHRQRPAIENIRFVLEEQLEGREVPPGDGDTEYVESLARPIRNAQALVAANELAVLWRLLAYLKPYSRQMTLGMLAAAIITLCSLVPPFLAGYLFDDVIRPSQDGQLSLGQASQAAWIAVAAIAAVYLLRQLCGWVRLRVMATLGEYVARDLRTDLYEHLQRLSLSFYSRKKTGSLITRVSSDTDRLWEFLAFGIVGQTRRESMGPG